MSRNCRYSDQLAKQRVLNWFLLGNADPQTNRVDDSCVNRRKVGKHCGQFHSQFLPFKTC